MHTSYKCSVCDIVFSNKRKWTAHMRSCEKMDIDIVEPKPARPRKKGIPAAVRFALWNAAFGEHQGVGSCFCCGRQISQQIFEAGHVVATSKGGSDALDNLRPICSMCNKSMGNTDMMEFIQKYKS